VLSVATGIKSPYRDNSGRYLRIFVIGRHSFGAEQSQELVKELRTNYLVHSGFPTGTTLFLGGAAAQGADLSSVLLRTFPWIIFVALLLTFFLLIRAFKSLVLPLKAILLDLISLAVAFGIVVFAFGNHSVSNFFGIYHLNQIEVWAMVFLFVLLFGVSMDYEVFIISRMKEAKDNGASNSEAILEGITQSGIVVTSAALIFIGAVSGLAFGHFAGLQELGIGLGIGVFIDATIIRGLLLPSLMILFGRWNWWLPSCVARILKTSPTPLDQVRG
jgi:RND superfamily putative drug exporter